MVPFNSIHSLFCKSLCHGNRLLMENILRSNLWLLSQRGNTTKYRLCLALCKMKHCCLSMLHFHSLSTQHCIVILSIMCLVYLMRLKCSKCTQQMKLTLVHHLRHLATTTFGFVQNAIFQMQCQTMHHFTGIILIMSCLLMDGDQIFKCVLTNVVMDLNYHFFSTQLIWVDFLLLVKKKNLLFCWKVILPILHTLLTPTNQNQSQLNGNHLLHPIKWICNI
mmetsp:Transcript_21094/g.31402  ORF Transcript_21094/g.31402 Transcript_21094/m.31402 type:complete len:221 (-) Transcript_21094:196-858(-)